MDKVQKPVFLTKLCVFKDVTNKMSRVLLVDSIRMLLVLSLRLFRCEGYIGNAYYSVHKLFNMHMDIQKNSV
jgi:hypothetical protein